MKLTSSNLRKVLTRPRLEAWLEAQGGRMFKRGTLCFCPVAEFLREHGFPWASVGYSYIDEWQECVQTPGWVAAFIKAVDRRGGTAPRIRASTALRILRAL